MYGRKYKNFKKGSFLVLALIVLSVVLMMTLAVMLGASVSRENANTMGKSSQSFQSSDSGLEAFNQIFMNNKYSTVLNTTNFSGYACVNSAAQITGTSNSGDTYTIKPYDKQATPAPLACGSTIGQIGSAKVLSVHGGTVRAISAGAPASGFYPDGDYSLVSWWKFDTDFNDTKGVSNGTFLASGTAPTASPITNVIKTYNSKKAVVFNEGITPGSSSNNYLQIPHNSAYATQDGTWSFWYYAESSQASTTWVPFSKDQYGCCQDANNAALDCTAYSSCGSFVENSSNHDCDCGQLTLFGKSTNGDLYARFSNDGDADTYHLDALSSSGEISGVLGNWHLVTTTWNNQGYNLYIDGKFVKNVSSKNGSDTGYGTTGQKDTLPEGMLYSKVDIWLGKQRTKPTATQIFFKGGIRDLRFYNRALEPDEVKRLYTETK